MTGQVRHGPLADVPWEAPFEGVQLQRIDGERCTLLFYRFAPGAEHGLHSHPQEQLMRVDTGSLRLHLEGTRAVVLDAGGYCVIPGDVEHGVAAGDEGCTLTVVIAPRRTTGYVTRPLG